MSNLTDEDFVFPNFINSHPAITVGVETEMPKIDPTTSTPIAEKIVLPFDDASKISVFSGVSFLNIGDTRCGKSRMMRDIAQFYFGGEADFWGKSHLEVARNDFTAEGYFMTTDQSKIGEGKGSLAEARVPNERRVKALCNLMDEINGAIPEVQIEFFGMAEGRHKNRLRTTNLS